ncbi:glycerate kinase [Rufibacter quisquiliarum]|uniref:Glycerate kinase n=1 Tax=Rufibacter quisquiliarum TaxID=1549639 RepID=A0A839GJF2_9BACT|nr:glycerate kinase [Rufibacter quisquiliarum]MBA9076889.1 glycerate kinase [Rufibacter quisquiliarum]
MNIVIAPDSYKGSLSAKEVGLTIQEAFQMEAPEAKVWVVPMADGGEGTLETLLYSTNGTKVETTASGPLGHAITTGYGILGDGRTAVIEIAQIAGLTMVPDAERNPMQTTTYGVGELIKEALGKGIRNFIIGLGGSATNDGGLGMMQALGVVFQDEEGKPVQPIGASLSKIVSVDFAPLLPQMKECQFKIASDVKNPLCGSNGASFTYGSQKGASQEQVVLLDKGMRNFADLIEQALQQKLQQMPGAGAAGGLGFAFLALGATLEPGAQLIANAAGLDRYVQQADWVITGEGQSDYQTLYGKLPLHIAQVARSYGKPTILISGALGRGHEQLLPHFFSCHAITHAPVTLQEAMASSKENLYFCARNIARLISKKNH